jgi:hypothetical protein
LLRRCGLGVIARDRRRIGDRTRAQELSTVPHRALIETPETS